jgi:dTDP-4-amino-4,6-dideoxygalactose transaminase
MTNQIIRSPKKIFLSIPHMGGSEFSYVKDAFESNWLSTVGPNIDAVESEFSRLTGCNSVAVSSGTVGLHLALRLINLKPDEEVVTQSLTFVASANPILQERAKPVFIDSEPIGWNLDPNLLSDFLSKRAKRNCLPKAVIVVHLFGQPAYIADILTICQKYNLPLIEDAAESLGSRYNGKHPGSFGEIGVFSFNGNKMITGTTGGMLISKNSYLAQRARHLSTQARDADPQGNNNYIHSEIGYNYRMSNVIAGIVRGQLDVLNERVVKRREIFEKYRTAFASIPGIKPQSELYGATFGPEASDDVENATFHSRWLSCFLIDKKSFGMTSSELVRWLEAANIEARPVWKPMHLQPLYSQFESVGGSVAEDLNSRGICLPSSTSLTKDSQDFIIKTILSAHRNSVGGGV